MKLDSLIKNSLLKKLIRVFDKGDVVFSEGNLANTVILVLGGAMELTRKSENQCVSLVKVGAGEFIGEKALLQEQPFHRTATATALTPTTLLELGPHQFAQLETEAPQLYSLLLKKAFKTLVARQTKSEHLNEILKGYDPRKRFLQYVHFVAGQGEKGPQGRLFSLEGSQVSNQINYPKFEVETWIQELIDQKLIIPKDSGMYATENEDRLLGFEPSELPSTKAA